MIGEMEIKSVVNDAIKLFIEQHTYLLKHRANERSITHQFAVCLAESLKKINKPELHDLSVDCEYNRDGSVSKKIKAMAEKRKVYPDIVVHRRGKCGVNLLTIEAKKEHRNSDFDKEKIKAYIEEFGYKFGLFLVIPLGSRTDFQCEWFKYSKDGCCESFV